MERLAAVDELTFDLILANEDAAVGVLGRVSAMDEDAIKTFHAQQEGQLAATRLPVEGLVTELRRLGGHVDVVHPSGDGGDAFQLFRLYFRLGHSVGQSAVHILDGVAKVFPIDIKMADGVAVALVTAVEFKIQIGHFLLDFVRFFQWIPAHPQFLVCGRYGLSA